MVFTDALDGENIEKDKKEVGETGFLDLGKFESGFPDQDPLEPAEGQISVKVKEYRDNLENQVNKQEQNPIITYNEEIGANEYVFGPEFDGKMSLSKVINTNPGVRLIGSIPPETKANTRVYIPILKFIQRVNTTDLTISVEVQSLQENLDKANSFMYEEVEKQQSSKLLKRLSKSGKSAVVREIVPNVKSHDTSGNVTTFKLTEGGSDKYFYVPLSSTPNKLVDPVKGSLFIIPSEYNDFPIKVIPYNPDEKHDNIPPEIAKAINNKIDSMSK